MENHSEEQRWVNTARELVLNDMDPEAQRQVAIYVDKRVFTSGSALPIPNQEWLAPRTSRLLFIDLIPRMDWGHACRYLLIDEDQNRILETRDWEFPPPVDHLELVHSGDGLESWMLLTQGTKNNLSN